MLATVTARLAGGERITQNGCLDAYLHMVTDLGVAVSALISGAPQCHVLHDGDMIPHPGCLSNDNTCMQAMPSAEFKGLQMLATHLHCWLAWMQTLQDTSPGIQVTAGKQIALQTAGLGIRESLVKPDKLGARSGHACRQRTGQSMGCT